MELVLGIGQDGRQECAVYSGNNRELGIRGPFALLRQVFGPCMGVDAVDDGFKFTGAAAKPYQYPHHRMQDTTAHDTKGGADIRHCASLPRIGAPRSCYFATNV